MAALASWAARAWLSLRTKRGSNVEGCAALRTESGLGWIIETTFLASALERRRALNAELRALRVFG
jgi:hypothetical protein